MADDSEHKALQLSRRAALWHAFRGLPMDHFPLRLQGDQPVTLPSDDIIKEIGAALADLRSGPEDRDEKALEALVSRSRESLDEVKAQTEYQDQKATRLLTVASLFVALAGLLFKDFAQTHPIRIVWGGALDPVQLLTAPVHIAFGLFVLSVVAGALVTFHATRTRFRYPKRTNIEAGREPRSQIFFMGIIRATPGDWVRSFIETAGSGTAPAKDLSLRYAKNYIAESYLVAAKVADKMRYLEAGQAILAFSLKMLMVWLVLLAVVSATLPGREPAASATKPRIEQEAVRQAEEPVAAPAPAPKGSPRAGIARKEVAPVAAAPPAQAKPGPEDAANGQ